MSERLQLFGYGGLLWKPETFEFSEIQVGYISGYQRRFWQGSVTHRGTKEQWGRVATLIPTGNPEDKVWGAMFVITGEEAIKSEKAKVDNQEIHTGKYEVDEAIFYPRGTRDENDHYTVVVYIARDTNELFWREDDVDKMAEQVVSAQGFAGPNIEYVTKLADYLRNNVPEEQDKHLFDLDEKVREKASVIA